MSIPGDWISGKNQTMLLDHNPAQRSLALKMAPALGEGAKGRGEVGKSPGALHGNSFVDSVTMSTSLGLATPQGTEALDF